MAQMVVALKSTLITVYIIRENTYIDLNVYHKVYKPNKQTKPGI